MRIRKGVDTDAREDGEELRREEGGETPVRIHYMRKKSISNKRKNGKSNKIFKKERKSVTGHMKDTAIGATILVTRRNHDNTLKLKRHIKTESHCLEHTYNI